ncbi:MAG TPA: hypothetical protein DCY20_03465 [Firmicutes bacterium]|nr:hypothetical protein [Bacillota bacterium]
MRYSTNQFTKVTGVTVDALRYYEKNNICIPEKNQNNNYRQYSNHDAIKVLMTKLYRNLDVPVSDICQKINGCCEDDQVTELNFVANKVSGIDLEIKRLTLLRERLIDTEKKLGDINVKNPLVSVVELPSIYKVKSNLKCMETEKLIRELIEFFPFAVPSLTIGKSDLNVANYEPLPVQLGVHITEEFVQKLNINVNSLMEYYPKGLGMRCDFWIKDFATLTNDKLHFIFEQLEQQGYELMEDICVRVISVNQIKGEIMYLTTLCAKVQAI